MGPSGEGSCLTTDCSVDMLNTIATDKVQMSDARKCPRLRAEFKDHEQEREKPDEPPISDQFRVHDDDSANWLIRKIIECRAYAERCADWAEREQRRAKR